MTEQIKNILFSYRRRVHCTLQLTIIIRVPPQKNKIVVGITLIFYICLAGCWWWLSVLASARWPAQH